MVIVLELEMMVVVLVLMEVMVVVVIETEVAMVVVIQYVPHIGAVLVSCANTISE